MVQIFFLKTLKNTKISIVLLMRNRQCVSGFQHNENTAAARNTTE